MPKHMVEEAGSRFFEMASSLGRMHERTLSGLADATSKTPLGPVFAINASLARMANEGMDTLASRLTVVTDPVVSDAPKPAAKAKVAPKPTAKPKAAAKPVQKAVAKLAEKPVVAKSPKPAAKPKVAKKPAPLTVETSAATTAADMLEPDVADVLVEDVVAVAELPAKPKAAIAKDDLTRINGIGATTAKKLHGAGIENFAQIAKMSDDQFAALLTSLEVKSIRFSPNLWIEEAKKLSA